MKKLFFSVLMSVFAIGTFASNTPYFIVTDCGTVHQVPNCLTDEEAAAYVDYYTKKIVIQTEQSKSLSIDIA